MFVTTCQNQVMIQIKQHVKISQSAQKGYVSPKTKKSELISAQNFWEKIMNLCYEWDNGPWKAFLATAGNPAAL